MISYKFLYGTSARPTLSNILLLSTESEVAHTTIKLTLATIQYLLNVQLGPKVFGKNILNKRNTIQYQDVFFLFKICLPKDVWSQLYNFKL